MQVSQHSTQQLSEAREVSTRTDKSLFYTSPHMPKSKWNLHSPQCKSFQDRNRKTCRILPTVSAFLKKKNIFYNSHFGNYSTPWKSQWQRWRFLEADSESSPQARDSYLQPAFPQPCFVIWRWKYTKWGELPEDFGHHLHKNHIQKQTFPLRDIIY